MKAFVNCIQNREDEWESEGKGREGRRGRRAGEKRRYVSGKREDRKGRTRVHSLHRPPALYSEACVHHSAPTHATTNPHTMHSPTTNQQSWI